MGRTARDEREVVNRGERCLLVSSLSLIVSPTQGRDPKQANGGQRGVPGETRARRVFVRVGRHYAGDRFAGRMATLVRAFS